MRFRTKLFVEERVLRRRPDGSGWDQDQGSDPVDRQMDQFLADSRGHPSLVSAPSFYATWLDREMTAQRVLIGVVLTYIPPEAANEPADDARQWPEYAPAEAGGGRPPGGDRPGPA